MMSLRNGGTNSSARICLPNRSGVFSESLVRCWWQRVAARCLYVFEELVALTGIEPVFAAFSSSYKLHKPGERSELSIRHPNLGMCTSGRLLRPQPARA